MKTITISLIAISLFLYSCGNTMKEKSKEQSETVTHEEHQHNDEMKSIELNNGVKWKVDDNMIIHIRNMEGDVNAFKVKSTNDYVALAEKIKSNIELLTSNCTMKGQAHDELHKWLLPFIELSDEFSDSKKEQESAAVYQKIETSFILFNTYFE
ncbi:MAG: hypothetical protein ABI844_02325 [Saprospiraceae bacterium]